MSPHDPEVRDRQALRDAYRLLLMRAFLDIRYLRAPCPPQDSVTLDLYMSCNAAAAPQLFPPLRACVYAWGVVLCMCSASWPKDHESARGVGLGATPARLVTSGEFAAIDTESRPVLRLPAQPLPKRRNGA